MSREHANACAKFRMSASFLRLERQAFHVYGVGLAANVMHCQMKQHCHPIGVEDLSPNINMGDILLDLIHRGKIAQQP